MNKECKSDGVTYTSGVYKCKRCKGVWAGKVTPICEPLELDKLINKK